MKRISIKPILRSIQSTGVLLQLDPGVISRISASNLLVVHAYTGVAAAASVSERRLAHAPIVRPQCSSAATWHKEILRACRRAPHR
ncbi:hypothetical protein CYMTET_12071 [Cymbomonas tetramitiformis]|uniref:Uncharacterized protein n=1 Tax=Cymbomonas tetramitiformis TaxID=36881 RepID=A0AAE0GKT3_9CHLO|nr:hypothetical protein CYMTET_12071 [Cymbomonas tetramitiformis]